jgi:CHAD domain-containing protein
VGWALVDILGRRLEPALASLAVDLEAAEDPRAALRELRIASRRLRAFTQVYADPIRDKRARALRKRLRKITRAAGEIRQWDAHIALVASIRESPDPLQRAALEHVTAWLHEKRETAAHAGGRRLEHHERKRLAADLSHHLDHVGGQLLRAGDDAAARVRPWLAAVLRPLACRLGPPVTEDDMERLHAVRIVAKRTRYLLELTRPAIEAEYRSVRRPAKRVQRTIGRYHDAALLQTLLTARRDELRERGFVTLAGALQPILDRLVLERATACTAALPWTRAFGAQALRSFADALDPAEPATPATPATPAESPASPPDQSDDGLT